MQNNTNAPINIGYIPPTIQEAKSNENLTLGTIAGIIAAIIGAVIWAEISYLTNWQIGLMAIGVGLLVGFAVRFFGKGTSTKFGIIGAILALFGCLLGNLLTACLVIADMYDISIFRVLSFLDFELIGEIMTETFSPMDIIFYALAIYEGFKFSIKRTEKPKYHNLLPKP